MKNIFTKTIGVIATIFLVAGLCAPAFAQYGLSTIASNAGVSAIAKDSHGNTYVIENLTQSSAGGEIVEYTNGTGSGNVIYSGSLIAGNDFANSDNYGFGIVVDSNNNIYFSTSNGQTYTYGAIIKLTYNGSSPFAPIAANYSAGVYINYNSQGGVVGYPEGLAMDSSNDLFVLLFDLNATTDGFGAYTVAKYTAGSSTSYTEIYKGFELAGTFTNGETYSSICAIAVDPVSGDVYAADWYDTRLETYAGFIEKLTWNGSSYSPSTLYNNSAYCQALACDGSGNLYANIGSASDQESNVETVEFVGGAGSPVTLEPGLHGDIDYWCFGMAVIGSNIFTGEGDQSASGEGYYMELKGPALSTSGSPSALSTITGTASSSTSFSVSGSGLIANVTATAPSGFDISLNNSTWSGSGGAVTLTESGGNFASSTVYVRLDAGDAANTYSGNVSFTSTNLTAVNVAIPSSTVAAQPVISTSGTPSALSTITGTASSSTSFSVSGAHLVASITATAPSGFDVSLNNSTWSSSGGSQTITESGGTVSGQTVYVRLDAGDAANTYSSNLSLSSTSASTVNVSIPSSTVSAVPAISPTGTPSALSTTSGTASSSTSFFVSGTHMQAGILVTPPAGFEVSLNNSSFSSTVTVGSSGTISSTQVYIRLLASDGDGNYSGNIALTSTSATTVNVSMPSSAVTTPVIGESGTLSALSTTSGTASSSESFSVSGTNMVAGILVTPPTGFEVSLNNSAFVSTVTVGSSGTIASTPVYIRLAASDGANSYSGNVALTSTSATTVNVSMPSSTVTNPSTSISSLTPNTTLTNAASVTYTATFAASVSGVNSGDFLVINSGLSGAFVSNVSGSGTTWAITVSTGSGDGSLQLEMNSSGGVSPSVSNATAVSPFAGTVVSVDKTLPTVAIGSPNIAYANSSTPVSWQITWSDANLNTSSINASGIFSHVNTTGTATVSTSINLTPGAGGNPTTAQFVGLTGDGTLGFTVPAGSAQDNAGNSAAASSPSSTVIVDNTAPTITISAPSVSVTNTGPVSYTVTYADANFSANTLSTSNVTFNNGGTSAAPGSITVTPVSATVSTVTLSGITGNGTLGISIAAGTATDLAGNSAPASSASATFTVNNTPPTVSSITATTPTNANPTNATSVTYTVTFSEPVTGVNPGSFALTTTNTATGSLTNVTGSGTTYTETISGVSGDGTIRLDFTNSGSAVTDPAGNVATAYTGGDVYTIDNTPPNVTSLVYSTSNANSSYAKTGDVITLSFGATEAIQAPSVTITGHSITATNTGGNNYSASYTMTSGDIEGRIPFALTVTDLAGNPTSTTDVAAGDDITFDMTPPTATLGNPSVASVGNTGSSSVTYTLTYADANFNTSSVSPSNITLNSPETATGTIGVTGSGTSYTITISNITGQGALGISVAGGLASDLAGNLDAGTSPSATFNVLSSDATLSNIALSSAALSPTFNSSRPNYGVFVNASVNTLTVTPTTTDPGATVTVNGQPASTPVTLGYGYTTIPIVVTAADGVTTMSYQVLVKRPQSSDDYLSAISFTPLTPFTPASGPGDANYTATVSSTTASVTETPVTHDPTATVTVNGTAVTSGNPSGPIALQAGANTVTTVVTAQDGSKRTIIVTVTRNPASDDYLSTIYLNPLTPLTAGSGPGDANYTASVAYSQSSVKVVPVTHDGAATVTVNGQAVTSGSPSQAINLNVGANTITTVVTAQNGATRTTIITVTRAPNNDAYLTGISLTPLTPLTASDGPGDVNYTASVGNTTGSVTETPVARDPNATITVNGQAVTSGTASQSIALSVGSNTITTVVTAQDGSTKRTMIITITRAAPPASDGYQAVSVETPTETPTLADDGILVHQGVSPNGDGIDDFLTIDHINSYPDNRLMIMNRNGQLVYETKGYDNSSKVFDGHSNKNGQMQLPGTYFYSLDYTVNGIIKHKTGFLVLKY